MQVKELIKSLKKYNEDLEIEIETVEDMYSDFRLDEAYPSLIIKTF